jgi:hypothetical protein
LDIEGQNPTKRIMTKHLGQNIITILRGTNTSKAKERRNGDDDNNELYMQIHMVA